MAVGVDDLPAAGDFDDDDYVVGVVDGVDSQVPGSVLTAYLTTPHVTDATGAHAASAISVTPAGGVSSNNVQDALEEVDAARASTASSLTAHTAATTSVHGITDTAALETTTGAQAKADAAAAAAEAAAIASAESSLGDHEAASPAHAASAVSIADAGGYFTSADVEGALQELGAGGGGGGGITSEQALDTVGAAMTAGDGIDIVFDDALDTITVSAETATDTNAGIVELATTSEATTGTDTTRAVTPAGLKAATDALATVYQPLDADLTALAAAGNSTVLAATTASFTTDDESKLDNIEALADVTDAANVDAAGAVMEADYNANTILAASSDNTPAALTVGEQTLVGRITAGSIAALTATQVRTLLNVADGATDDTTVDAHIADTTDAHDASAISFSPAEGIAATDVQAAIQEVVTDAAATYVPLLNVPVVVSGTADTLASGDNGKINRYTNASAVTVTLPTDAADDLADGFNCTLICEGAGGLSLDTTGLTIAGGSNTSISQGEAMVVVKTATANTWNVIGGTA